MLRCSLAQLKCLVRMTLSLSTAWCSSTEVNTGANQKCPCLAQHAFSGSVLGPLRGLHPHEQQRETRRERVGVREGMVFIEKWGFAVPFLALNHFRSERVCPSFVLAAQPKEFGLRLRLVSLTQDGEPDSSDLLL